MPPGNSTGAYSELHLLRRALSLPTLVSLAVVAGMLVFMVTSFDIDIASTWGNIRDSNLLLYTLAIGIHYLTFMFRGARWRVLLLNINDQSPCNRTSVLSTIHCAKLLLLSWFINSLSWFRLGDAYRAYAYSEETGFSFSSTAGTVLAERVVDVIMVSGLLITAAIVMTMTGAITPPPALLITALTMVLAMAVLLFTMRLFRSSLARLLPGVLESAYHRLHTGTMASFRRLHLVFLLGLLAWLCEVGRLYFVIHAISLSIGAGLILFATVANALLSTVPLTPAGLGIVEAGVTGLLMLALPREKALSIVLLDRSISYFSIIIVGGLLFTVRQVIRTRRQQVLPTGESEGRTS